ncbi:MAG: YtxH domain-containing protein [Actinobacteria bacterium]|nr:YtxH domain-containing protein [Actinomycetota bacterium]
MHGEGLVDYHSVMKFRLGVAVGFAFGYYFGARAGRERYEKMRQAIAKARDSGALQKARAAVELGVERVRREPTIDITASVVEELATS